MGDCSPEKLHINRFRYLFAALHILFNIIYIIRIYIWIRYSRRIHSLIVRNALFTLGGSTRLLINVLSVTNFQNEYQQALVFYAVKNSKYADSYTVNIVVGLKFTATAWSGLRT